MARVMIAESILQDVANAIRTASSSSETMRPIDFANKILNLSGDASSYVCAETYVSSSTLDNDKVDKEKLTYAYFPYATSMDSNLFSDYSKLVAISAPSLTTLPMYFLQNCNQLASASFPAVTRVEDYAFQSCYQLNRIDLPSCTDVSYNAFMSFNGDIHFAAANESAIKKTKWYQNMGEGYSRAYFDLYASESGGGGGSVYCTEVTTMTSSTMSDEGYSDISSKNGIKYAYVAAATTLDSGAFEMCNNLQSAYLPKAESITSESFRYCYALKDIHVPKANKAAIINAMGWTESGNPKIDSATVYFDLFKTEGTDPADVNCTISSELTTVTNNDVRSGELSQYFNSETYSSTIIKPLGGSGEKSPIAFAMANCTEIGENAFSGSILSSVEMPNVLTVGNYAFQYCQQLTSISLPAATSIGESAFQSCQQLTSISLPAATSIGNYAFSGCYQLTSISLPAATSIGNYAFQSCQQLTSISLPAATDLNSYSLSGANFTEVHFAAANQSIIESLSGYSNKFGASSATFYFDL